MIQQSRAFHRLEGDTTVTVDEIPSVRTDLSIFCLGGNLTLNQHKRNVS